MNKTCFVISPIGDKNTEIRNRADSLYDLIIEPALEKYSFSVTRADKSNMVSSITSEIVQLVQDSGLCIIDITGHNANVMYECGRRHETGKPFIMMAEEGEILPFDINTIRTIFYNLSDAREIRNTVKTLQSMIDTMLETDLEPERSGVSLSALSDTLTRIERKIDRLSVSNPDTTSSNLNVGTSEYRDILSSLGTVGAFNYALTQRDIGLAEYLMPNLKRQMTLEKYVDFVLTQAAPLGSTAAHKELENLFSNSFDTFGRKLQQDYIGSLVSGYNMQDRESYGLELLRPFFEKIVATETPSSELSNKEKAFFLNQYQKLLYGHQEYEDALNVGKDVLSLAPDDMSYIYNYSILCTKLGASESAYNAVKGLYALMNSTGDYDVDHLNQVIKIFASNKDVLAREAFVKLQEVNPFSATMLTRDKELRAFLQG
jgi:hypothetical protein